jgi:prevent-host-death family protein
VRAEQKDMQQVNVEEAKAHLPDLIKAAANGEEVIITENEQPVVRLVPISKEKPKRQFGGAKGLIIFNEGWDEPLEDFKEYME